MTMIKITRKQRLIATICISTAFFVSELIAGLYTHSLALVADAFHYLSDVVGFTVALIALIVSESPEPPPQEFTFGWQRATLLGAFFNGVFLLALAVSILVQAIERFTDSPHIEQPKIVLIVGCVGLGLNLLVMSFLHEHNHEAGHVHGQSHSHSQSYGEHIHEEDLHWEDERPRSCPDADQGNVEHMKHFTSISHFGHKHAAMTPSRPGKDLGLLGVFIHVVGDAINNVGVIIAALIIWLTDSPMRYYADPAISIFIAIMIFMTSLPLTKKSGSILLQTAPLGINIEDVKHDIEMVEGVQSVHELHIWRLNQQTSIATAHIVIDDRTITDFTETAMIIMECLHAYGVHSATLQPEAVPSLAATDMETASTDNETTTIREGQINLIESSRAKDDGAITTSPDHAPF
ncbi:hypothetical protein E4U21_007284 [Claviceps maximensis]|nr:hypothetical protein E4U21_007284 [Claviceps maximensis]